MQKLMTAATCMLLTATFAFAQTDRPEPTYDALRAFLGDTSVDCLIANKTAMRDAGAADLETLRGLQQTLRQTKRDGGDTTSIEAQIEEVRTRLEALRDQYAQAAQACVDPSLRSQLVDAEALMAEVHQAVSLLAVDSTRETPEGFGDGGQRPGGALRRGPGF